MSNHSSGFDPRRSIFSETVRALRERPLEWRRERSNLIHGPTGICVWIGNDTYGMHIADSPYGYELWGGVTGLSSFGLSLKHRRLRKAANFCLGAIAMEARQGGDGEAGSVRSTTARAAESGIAQGDRP